MKLASFLEKFDRTMISILKTLTIALFVLLMVILTANVFVRFFPVLSLHWLDEVVELLFAALVFYGAAAAWILKGHFSAGDWIEKRMAGPRGRAAVRLVIDVISFAFIAVFFRYSAVLVSRSLETTAVFQIPKKFLYLSMPVSSGIMLLYSVRYMAEDALRVFAPKAVNDANMTET